MRVLGCHWCSARKRHPGSDGARALQLSRDNGRLLASRLLPHPTCAVHGVGHSSRVGVAANLLVVVLLLPWHCYHDMLLPMRVLHVVRLHPHVGTGWGVPRARRGCWQLLRWLLRAALGKADLSQVHVGRGRAVCLVALARA